MTTTYTLQRCSAPKKNASGLDIPDKFYGKVHGSWDCEKTLCGMDIENSMYHWYVLTNCFDGEITCKKCKDKES